MAAPHPTIFIVMVAQQVTPLTDTPANGQKAKRGYPSFDASAAITDNMADMLGVSLGHMGKLLGVKGYHNVYRWRIGTRRPSAVILARFVVLLYLKQVRGVHPAMLRRVDWEGGQAYLRDGNEVEVGRGRQDRLPGMSNTGRRADADES